LSLAVSVFSPLAVAVMPSNPKSQIPNQMSQLVYTCHSVYSWFGKGVLVIRVVGGA
jgi:hypothetical protein